MNIDGHRPRRTPSTIPTSASLAVGRRTVLCSRSRTCLSQRPTIPSPPFDYPHHLCSCHPRRFRRHAITSYAPMATDVVAAALASDLQDTVDSPLVRGQLPVEVCEMILDSFSDWPRGSDRDALRACMQVCRAWVPRCRLHLAGAVSFRSRDSVTSFAGVLERSPQLRMRVETVRVEVKDTGDQSWVSSVPLLLPMLLKTLFLENVDLSVLHPVASNRFYALRVQALHLQDVKYTHYSQLAHLVNPASVEEVHCRWGKAGEQISSSLEDLQDYVPGGRVPHTKRRAQVLYFITVYGLSVRAAAGLLQNLTVLSATPLTLSFVLPDRPDADRVRGFAFVSPPALNVHAVSSARPSYADLPADHRALWRHVSRVWQAACCRGKREGMLEGIKITNNREERTFDLYRDFPQGPFENEPG